MCNATFQHRDCFANHRTQASWNLDRFEALRFEPHTMPCSRQSPRAWSHVATSMQPISSAQARLPRS